VIAVVGLDLSVAAIGIALPDGSTRTIRPHTPPSDPARRLHELLDRTSARLQAHRPVLAVIEDYALAGHQGATMARLAELGGVIRLRLFELGIPYVEIKPTSLKKWATGNGRASKTEMVAAAQAAGADIANDDEADAYLLRAVALAHYHPDRDLRPLSDALRRVPWPALTVSA
jgi:crossover junction endodeoxyribonuclease RuvC